MWNVRSAVVTVVVFFFVGTSSQGEEPKDAKPLARAHAHNDYVQKRPLAEALERGFCSVEADVFLVEGKLLVAHSYIEIAHERTLQKLYLDPLRERVKSRHGKVYRDGPEFTLMIDFKTEAEPTYRALAKVLAVYADMLSVVKDGKLESKAVRIVLSGNRPREIVAAEKERFAGIDGRMSDLESDAPEHLLPWISDNWKGHFKWTGRGEMPEEERKKLREIVAKAHERGRKVRFWGAPDRREAWQELYAAGVDLINTDKLAELAKFLRE